MRDGFGMLLVLLFPLVFLYYLAALINPKWFSRSKLTTSRAHILLSYVLLVLCWVLLIIFASGAGGAWWLALALIPAYFSARAYQFKPEPKKTEQKKTEGQGIHPTQPPSAVLSPSRAQISYPTLVARAPYAAPRKTADQSPHTPKKPHDNRALPEIAQAILEDGIITLEEAQSLKSWFDQGDRIKAKKSYALYQVLSDSLKDSELSADESAELLKKLRGFLPTETPTYTVEHNKPVRVSATDNWTGLTIDCTYETAAGEISDRRLKVLTDNGYSIYCYCHMRHAKRTFVKHRMISAVDVESGEILVK